MEAFGVWRLAFGVWRLACGVWRVACGVWRVGVWAIAPGGEPLWRMPKNSRPFAL